jgi:pilus assembly protein Flp/PilA
MSRSLALRTIRDFLRAEDGATAIEYALIASGIAGAIIVVIVTLGTSVQNMYLSVSSNLH